MIRLLLLLLAIVFPASVATASITCEETSCDYPDGIEYSQAPPPIFSDSDDATFGLSFSSPVLSSLPVRDEGSSQWPDTDWYNDSLVYSGAVGTGQDFDVDEDTGDIYAIFDTDNATYDSATVYRSQDGGATWSFWRTSYSPSLEISNPMIRVVKDIMNQTWVCMFLLVDSTLMMRRMTPDQSQSAWETVTANPVTYFDVDGEAGALGWVYVTYIPDGTNNDIWAARNSMDGTGWLNNQLIYLNPGVDPYPSIAAATGGIVGIAFVDDRMSSNNEIRIKRSSNCALSWTPSVQISNNYYGASIRETNIAYNRGPTVMGWIFATCRFSHDFLWYHYSMNGGSNWGEGGLIGYTDPGDQNMPDIRAQKSSYGDLTLAYNSDPGDSTMFSYAPWYDPSFFLTPVRVNDYQATGFWHPTAGWVGDYSAVLYTSWSQGYRLYFDWQGSVANEEETYTAVTEPVQLNISPNPITDMATISFHITDTDPVSISVYSIAGRLMKTIVDSESFSPGDHTVQWYGLDRSGSAVVPGVYFCRLNTGGTTLIQRMVMVL